MSQPVTSSLSTSESASWSRDFASALRTGTLAAAIARAEQRSAEKKKPATPTTTTTTAQKENPPMVETPGYGTEIQFEEILPGDTLRVTTHLGDLDTVDQGVAARFVSGAWRTDTGRVLIVEDPHDALSRVIELVSRQQRDGLPQTTGSVVIGTMVSGVQGEFPLFRGRSAWHSGQAIGNGWLHHDADIQAWRPAVIVEDVIPQ